MLLKLFLVMLLQLFLGFWIVIHTIRPVHQMACTHLGSSSLLPSSSLLDSSDVKLISFLSVPLILFTCILVHHRIIGS